MSLALDPNASKVFLSKMMPDPKLKKSAVKLADKIASLFVINLATE